jgi:hypothetical protein
VLIVLFAGICDISRKARHEGGTQIILRGKFWVTENITYLKLRDFSHPKSVLPVATVPNVSLKAATEYYLQTGEFRVLKYDEKDIAVQQECLNEEIEKIDNQIVVENKFPQQLGGHGIVVPQFYEHQYIDRNSYKNNQGMKETGQKVKYRRTSRWSVKSG